MHAVRGSIAVRILEVGSHGAWHIFAQIAGHILSSCAVSHGSELVGSHGVNVLCVEEVVMKRRFCVAKILVRDFLEVIAHQFRRLLIRLYII